MNLNDLLVFAEVVERGGFTAAGNALAMPKSNVSRTVSRLEAALGVQLLERTTRKQTLTEIGQMYYEHCSRIKEELESASASIETLSETPKGRLRVCASVTVGQSLISQYLAKFARTYPAVKVDLRLTNRRVDLIDEGFDIVIRVGKLPDSNLIGKYLCSQELHLYAAPGYIEESDASLSVPDDLAKHRCLFMNAINERSQWQLQNGEEIKIFDFEPAFSCDNFYVLQQLAIDELGIAILPDYMCKKHLEDGRLIRVLDNWIGAKVDFHALVRSPGGVTPKIRVFLDFMSHSCNAQ
ncbi:MAG: LysR family transcriptional regulator [Betaproteobacteria bacterium]|nr:LysR family transcriptional regulator [Betaproteobacteria bacterium]